MGLAQIQRVLVRLYTDSVFREQFFANPPSYMKELGLTPEDLAYVQKISQQQLSDFANSLVHKRLHQVKRLLPLTCKLLESQFQPLFLAFAREHIPQGVKKHQQDAVAFARWLPSAWQSSDLPPWARELVEFEAWTLDGTRKQQRWQLRFFWYPVRRIAHELKAGNTYSAGKRPNVFCWYRFGNKPARSFVLPLL